MGDYKLLGIILIVIGVFGFIGTIGMTLICGGIVPNGEEAVSACFGMSLLTDLIFTCCGIGLLFFKKIK